MPSKQSKSPRKSSFKRSSLKRDFLLAAGWGAAKAVFLAGDASSRHYERLSLPEGTTAVLMDAPSAAEPIKPFIDIADLLLSQGFSAPEILHEDQSHGFLLLEDMGDLTYGRALKEGASEEILYGLAVDVLIKLHQTPKAGASLMPFDWREFQRELQIFIEWYCPVSLGRALTASEQDGFFQAWQETATALEGSPEVFILRDYHIDNLMWLRDRSGLDQCGLLDFQDARRGPVAYDLVSLLEDARRDIPAALQTQMKEKYLAAFPELDHEKFQESYCWLGAQRSTKILGIFTRLYHRDGKKAYLAHIPRVWKWLEQDLQNPIMQPVQAWFDQIFPDEKRVAPLKGRA